MLKTTNSKSSFMKERIDSWKKNKEKVRKTQ
jgi:hypothetical protein